MMTLSANEYTEVLAADAESIDAYLDNDMMTARAQRAVADANVGTAGQDAHAAELMLSAGLGEGRNFDGIRKGSPETIDVWPTVLADGHDARLKNTAVADTELRKPRIAEPSKHLRSNPLDDPIVRSISDRHPDLEDAFRNRDTSRLEPIFQSWALTGEVDMETIRYIRKRLDN